MIIIKMKVLIYLILFYFLIINCQKGKSNNIATDRWKLSNTIQEGYIQNYHFVNNIKYPTILFKIEDFQYWQKKVLNFNDYKLTNIKLSVPINLTNYRSILVKKIIHGEELLIFHTQNYLMYIFHKNKLLDKYKETILIPDTISCYPIFFDFDNDGIEEIVIPYFMEGGMKFCIYKLIEKEFQMVYNPGIYLYYLNVVLDDPKINQNIYIEFKHINNDKFYDFILYGAKIEIVRDDKSESEEYLKNGKQIFLSQNSYSFIKEK